MPPTFEDRIVSVYGIFNYCTVSFQARNETRNRDLLLCNKNYIIKSAFGDICSV